MKVTKGQMNIDFNEIYDHENDVYYVSFKTGEPSFAQELDDILLLEIGLFTKMPTGFRILNYSKHDVALIQLPLMMRKVKREMNSVCKQYSTIFKKREGQVEKALERTFATT